MKKTLFILVIIFLTGCSNREQSLLALIKEKNQEIAQLKKKNTQLVDEFAQKDPELKKLTLKGGPASSKEPQKATLKDGTKILAYNWEIAPKEIFNIPIGNSYYAGPADAKVTIIAWMDYQ